MNFMNIDYLKNGSSTQINVFKALRELQVPGRLSHFSPVLAGTFPLGLNIKGSDLDILCEVYDSDRFISRIQAAYGGQKGFYITVKALGGIPAIIGRFEYSGFPVEVFGQPKPVTDQHAFLHLQVEYQLLQDRLRNKEAELRSLKRRGWSTEEAFAALLELKGDPYKALIALGDQMGLFT
ncbi:DUF4269 domain-containing protein [Robertkochia sediminum]|uniref:DUF4269 domain-containing protein n=1 Tax=Robertkochia sediminum TaxID=2785326 RepID=UPI00193256CC|nr:DUF4269 domain-containing protein [Robertkochia sediminum]MBL7471850.1 DUF4269 domain-containing protein [Robertkochia sediminum]